MNQLGNILILLIITAALSTGAFFYYQSRKPVTPTNPYQTPIANPQPTITNSGEQTKTYESKNMKLSIEVPTKYQIIDQSTRILLAIPDGAIVISRAGTQFSDLNSYLKDLDSKNKIQIIDQNDLVINGYPAKIRTINFNETTSREMQFKILTETRVYTFSISSQSLYDDLDQIAKSFKYIP